VGDSIVNMLVPMLFRQAQGGKLDNGELASNIPIKTVYR